jgi:outer membrane protein assembly factor BamD (BamD/ComL family)
MSRLNRTATSLARCALTALVLTGGCATLRPGVDDDGLATHPGPSSSEVRQASFEETPANERGMSWSDFHIDNWGLATKKLVGRGPDREYARQVYRQADDLYRQAAAAPPGPHRQAIFELAAPKFAEAADRWPGSALEMDALFMAGESYFFADNYPQANHHYEKLVKTFPNNRYLDTVDQRRFAIARYWLEINRDSPEAFYYVNVLDKSRPWKDSRGNALRVLDKIRIDDPTGRLADDATLAAANEHFARGKFFKANEYYTDLRKAYPSSEHQFLAHFLGVKSLLQSYQGPAYGGTVLDDAEKLIKQIRRQFPQDAEREKEFLDRAAAEIRLRKAERLMFSAYYYDNRGEYRAADHYYAQVVRDYRDTPLAAKAEERVGQIAGLPAVPPQRMQWLVNLFPESDKVKPLLKATEEARLADASRASQDRNAEIEQAQAAGERTPVAGTILSNFFDR